MNFREIIQKNPSIAWGFVAALAVVVVLVFYHNATEGSVGTLKALYTSDDGKTWFKDDLRKLPPFDHDGKPAYRVQMFKVGGGKPFIGWMEAYDDEAKKMLEAVGTNDMAFATAMSSAQPRVKRPGDAKWVTTRDRRQYDAITTPKDPTGAGGVPQPIGPNE